jgi:hypothetical protein
MSQASAVPPHVAAWWSGVIQDRRHLASPHRGLPYLDVLAMAHRALAPRTYLEVGSQAGNSLALATCRSIAVDPDFRLPAGFREARPFLQTFEMGSDAFFAAHDPGAILGGTIDFAFLDGMHLFEYLLRDFINTERHCGPGSVIALHDCIPPTSAIVSRDGSNLSPPEFNVMPGAWAGDVWKLLLILEAFRPELVVTVFDCPPTGLAFVSGLNPQSRALRENYDAIVARYLPLMIEDVGVAEFVEGRSALKSRALSGLDAAAQARVIAPGRATGS